ncbi:MAG: hypothetical protein WCG61_06125 [Chlorobium sp.]
MVQTPAYGRAEKMTRRWNTSALQMLFRKHGSFTMASSSSSKD